MSDSAAAALRSVLVELGRPATKPNGGPFARLVFINGHGGNHSALTDALEILRSEGRDVAAWWPTIPHGDAHAGHPETSLLLAIAPHLVGVDRDHGSGGSSGEHRGAVVSVGRNTARRGALGEPDGNPRRCHRSQRHRAGERILSALVEQLISFLETSAA